MLHIHSRVGPALLFVAALGLAAGAVQLMTPIATDFFALFYPTTIKVLSGATNLYGPSAPNFYNLPWTVGVWMPLAVYPYPVAQFANTVLILGLLVAALVILRPASPLVLFTYPAFVLLVVGETDALVLCGLAILYVAVRRQNAMLVSVAFLMLAVKPPNVVLPCLLALYAFRNPRVLIIPTVAVIASAFLFGPDWMLRLLTFAQSTPPPAGPNISLWKSGIPPVVLAVALGLAAARLAYLVKGQGFTRETFSMAILVNVVFSPYLLTAHLVLLVPILAFAFQDNRRRGLAMWGAQVVTYSFPALYPLTLLALTVPARWSGIHTGARTPPSKAPAPLAVRLSAWHIPP